MPLQFVVSLSASFALQFNERADSAAGELVSGTASVSSARTSSRGQKLAFTNQQNRLENPTELVLGPRSHGRSEALHRTWRVSLAMVNADGGFSRRIGRPRQVGQTRVKQLGARLQVARAGARNSPS
jgi:hypothetical protein